MEAVLLVIPAIIALVRLSRKNAYSKWEWKAFIVPLVSISICVILAYSSVPGLGSPGRSILSYSPLNPGSDFARVDLGLGQFFLSRFLQPVIWFMVLALSVLAAADNKSQKFFLVAIACLLLSVCFEAFFLHPLMSQLRVSKFAYQVLYVVHLLLIQSLLLAFISGGFILIVAKGDNSPICLRYVAKVFLGSLIPVACCILISFTWSSGERLRTKVLAGAHYYLWFPENWKAGTIGHYTLPPIRPQLGYYATLTPAVFQQHVAWAKEAGISFFIYDWWPSNAELRGRVKELAGRSIAAQMSFAIQYEALDLKEPGDAVYPGEGSNIIYLDRVRSQRFVTHLLRIAKHYMSSPSYLRLDGKPVLFIYATRHLVGPVAETIAEARERIWQETGEEIFLIGDEVYFNVLDYRRASGVIMLEDLYPNWQRLSAFDAITCYNPYQAERLEFASVIGDRVNGARVFLDSSAQLFSTYRAYADILGQVFIPTAMPGYNDRGVRLAEDHFVVPRTLQGDGLLPSESRGQISFFSASLQQWVAPFMANQFQLMAITSWNEWNEWTAIEPSNVVSPTVSDNGVSGADYTKGIAHHGFGGQYLKELSDFIKNYEERTIK